MQQEMVSVHTPIHLSPFFQIVSHEILFHAGAPKLLAERVVFHVIHHVTK